MQQGAGEANWWAAGRRGSPRGVGVSPEAQPQHTPDRRAIFNHVAAMQRLVPKHNSAIDEHVTPLGLGELVQAVRPVTWMRLDC
jgi:hypothetical protein